ncbi:MAG: alanine racemase [Lachnospiraceae bacterium]|nr:alanine racemase [Lachnospiraceae bacterium]
MTSGTYLEISYGKLKHNLELVKKHAGSKSLICMVKDDAYGMGALNLSKVLENDPMVNAFAVANLKEALELKNSGIKKDIIIIGHVDKTCYEEVIANNFISTISTYDQAMELSEASKKLSKVARVEIAIDTGMGRIGFNVGDETIKSIKDISLLSNIKIYGVFSHFSVSDCEKEDTENVQYTNNQELKFKTLTENLSNLGVDVGMTSLSSSAGIFKAIGMDFDAVRPGIILYGIAPSTAFQNLDLKPIMSLKSHIVHIKNIEPETSISYGRTFVSKDNMKIATICCGYGDGYPRSASNKSSVIVNDKKCKIVGRITMDMLMVDVTDVDCKVDDEVILIGESNSEKITLDTLSEETGEFSYELLTRINKRVDRIYID